MNFPDTVSLSKQTGRNNYGGIEYGSAVSKKCRIEKSISRAVDRQGEFYTAFYRVFFEGDVSISLGDKITINSIDYLVNEIHQEADYNGKILITWVVIK